MNLLEKRTSEQQEGSQPTVVSRIERSKRRLARFLEAQSEKLSVRQKKTALIMFGLLAAATCTGLIVGPFIANDPKLLSIPAEIQTPTLKPLRSQHDSLMEQSSYKSLVRIKQIVDSLKYSPQGQARYDQLMRERPGLVDSLNVLLHEH